MKHYDEHKLELYVRRSLSVADDRKEIELHLNDCGICRELAEQISQYYNALDRTLNGQLALPARNDEIVVARPEVIQNIRPAPPRFPARVWAFARQRPFVSAFATVSFIAMVVAALNLFNVITPLAQKDHNLFEVRANGVSGRLEAFNKHSDTLWTLPWFSAYQPSHNEQALGTVQAVVADLYNSSKRQLISIIPGLGVGSRIPGRVVVQSYGSDKNQIIQVPLGERFEFNGKPFTVDFSGRGIVIEDFAGKGVKEIIVGVDHYDSPSVIYRLDAIGNVLGEYWHYGRIFGLFAIDLRKDGTKQLLICGIDDISKNAMLAVLDPDKINGKTESTATPGFTLAKSVAEEYYIAFSSCDLWDILNLPKPRVNRIVADGDNIDAFVADVNEKGVFRYSLSSKMDILHVASVDNTKRNYEQFKKAGKLSKELNNQYFEQMRGTVRYWDGVKWTASNTKVSSPPR